jgi:hypothetical protein
MFPVLAVVLIFLARPALSRSTLAPCGRLSPLGECMGFVERMPAYKHLETTGCVQYWPRVFDSYGSFLLVCSACEDGLTTDDRWKCQRCGPEGPFDLLPGWVANLTHSNASGSADGAQNLSPEAMRNVTLSAERNTTLCGRCRPGTEERGAACVRCRAGTFSQHPPNTTCQVCPDGTFSDVAAAVCTPCSAGMVCVNGTALPAPGFWMSQTTTAESRGEVFWGSVPTIVARCWAEERCPGGALELCTDGYVGIGCARCDEGYYAEGGACTKCPATVESVVHLVLFLLLLLAMLAAISVAGTRSGPVLRCARQILLLTIYVSSVEVHWPTPLRKFLSSRWLAIFLAKIDSVGIECVTPRISPANLSFVVVVTPMVSAFVVLMAQVPSCCFSNCARYTRLFVLCLRAHLRFMFQISGILVATLIYMVDCTSTESSGSHKILHSRFGNNSLCGPFATGLTGVLFIMSLGVGFVIPLSFVVRSGDREGQPGLQKLYDDLTDPYVEHRYLRFWEFATLFRTCVFVIPAALRGDPDARAVALIVLHVVAIGANAAARPFRDYKDNLQDSAELAEAALALALGLATESDGAGVFVIILIACDIVVAAVLSWLKVPRTEDGGGAAQDHRGKSEGECGGQGGQRRSDPDCGSTGDGDGPPSREDGARAPGPMVPPALHGIASADGASSPRGRGGLDSSDITLDDRY